MLRIICNISGTWKIRMDICSNYCSCCFTDLLLLLVVLVLVFVFVFVLALGVRSQGESQESGVWNLEF